MDELFLEPPPCWARAIAAMLALLAMPFLIVVGILRAVALLLLPPLVRLLMLLSPVSVIAGGMFAYRGDWNSVAQCAVLCVVISALFWVGSTIMARHDLPVRLR